MYLIYIGHFHNSCFPLIIPITVRSCRRTCCESAMFSLRLEVYQPWCLLTYFRRYVRLYNALLFPTVHFQDILVWAGKLTPFKLACVSLSRFQFSALSDSQNLLPTLRLSPIMWPWEKSSCRSNTRQLEHQLKEYHVLTTKLTGESVAMMFTFHT